MGNEINFVPITMQMSLFFTAGILGFLGYLSNRVRKSEVGLKDVSMWYGLGIMSLIVTWFPSVLALVQQVSGIQETPNFVLVLAIGVVTFIVAAQSIQLAKQRQRIRGLEQDVAILISKEQKEGK